MSINSKECRSERTHIFIFITSTIVVVVSTFKMKASYFVLGLMVALLISNLPASESGDCPPFPQHPCADSFKKGTPPTLPCCVAFKRESPSPCICRYVKMGDPKGPELLENGAMVARKCKILFDELCKNTRPRAPPPHLHTNPNPTQPTYVHGMGPF